MGYILLVTSLVVFTTYVAIIWHKYGILSSISASFYKLPQNRRLLFTFALWGFSFPVIIYAGLVDSPLLFLAGSSIAFTGSAAAYNRSKLDLTVHIVSAQAGVIAGAVHNIVYLHDYYIAVAVAIIALIIYKKVDKYVWWVEVLAFYYIIIRLLWS
jgi:hypothetical protein